MRLPLFSRTDSRKSRLRTLAALLLVVSQGISADIIHQTQVRAHQEYLSFTIDVEGAGADSFLANIESGYRARIEYILRVAEDTSPFLGIRQTQLPQFVVTYDAWWDPFRRRFVIETNDGDLLRFETASELWTFFFALDEFRVPTIAIPTEPDRPLVVETRASFYPIVFAPGLRILSVFARDARQRTPWVRTALPTVADQ